MTHTRRGRDFHSCTQKCKKKLHTYTHSRIHNHEQTTPVLVVADGTPDLWVYSKSVLGLKWEEL